MRHLQEIDKDVQTLEQAFHERQESLAYVERQLQQFEENTTSLDNGCNSSSRSTGDGNNKAVSYLDWLHTHKAELSRIQQARRLEERQQLACSSGPQEEAQPSSRSCVNSPSGLAPVSAPQRRSQMQPSPLNGLSALHQTSGHVPQGFHSVPAPPVPRERTQSAHTHNEAKQLGSSLRTSASQGSLGLTHARNNICSRSPSPQPRYALEAQPQVYCSRGQPRIAASMVAPAPYQGSVCSCPAQTAGGHSRSVSPQPTTPQAQLYRPVSPSPTMGSLVVPVPSSPQVSARSVHTHNGSSSVSLSQPACAAKEYRRVQSPQITASAYPLESSGRFQVGGSCSSRSSSPQPIQTQSPVPVPSRTQNCVYSRSPSPQPAGSQASLHVQHHMAGQSSHTVSYVQPGSNFYQQPPPQFVQPASLSRPGSPLSRSAKSVNGLQLLVPLHQQLHAQLQHQEQKLNTWRKDLGTENQHSHRNMHQHVDQQQMQRQMYAQ
eukprot:TRINITY_DN6118_c0_g1_i1.p1 TRINITY_DN6118_c0_g1~~TRINITY_DN6118_c0_g1_i1.p1  ORF type:complete len:490 (-),score=65.64 TRINITY_DN6118_c0_g1_i1:23-1492(-)